MGKATRWLKGLFSGGGGGKKTKWVFAKSSNKARENVGSEDRSGLVAGGGGGGLAGKREEGDGDDQSKRAIAVAAATAAMAEAAVAAAHAAAAVARLTSSGRVCGAVDGSGRRTEEWAAVRIQSIFRGHLARKALKALKGLVKVQALVRGRITRKQTAEALRYMQELFRVQAREHACRVLADRLRPGGGSASATHHHHHHRHRKATGCSFDLNSSQYSSSGWLDQWMEERYMVNHETLSRAAGTSATDDDKNAKILEIDPGKPDHSMSSDPKNIRSFTTVVTDSPSKDSTVAHGSDSSLSSVGNQLFPGANESSPQYHCSRRTVGGPLTPSKSESSRSAGGGCYPNYMAYTQSSRAKARSQSAPKQRPTEFERSCFARRVTSSSSAAAATAVASHGPHLGFTGKAYPGSGRLDRTGMPMKI